MISLYFNMFYYSCFIANSSSSSSETALDMPNSISPNTLIFFFFFIYFQSRKIISNYKFLLRSVFSNFIFQFLLRLIHACTVYLMFFVNMLS
jgi:hypothetical protein